jgi:hypothetical protein
MLEGLFRTVEEKLVRKCLSYKLQRYDDRLFHKGKGG